MKKLSQNQALELAFNTLQKNGASKENALPLALGIIDAENQGIKSHGFHYFLVDFDEIYDSVCACSTPTDA